MPHPTPDGRGGAPAVLQVLQHLEPDEVGRSAVDVARYLRAKGWRSVVASAGGRLERELAAAGATHLRLPLDRMGWLAVWRNGGRLARAIRRHRVDLVHARAPAPAWSGSIAARRTGASFVATFHDVYPLEGALNRRCHGAMAGADRVIAVSDFMAGHLAREHGVDPTRVGVVHRWIDPDEFDPERVRGHRVQALAERWGIGAGSARVVMMPGSVTRGRGHLLLLQALARLARTDCTVLFVGGLDHRGAYVKELTTAVRKAGLGERVRFGGDTEDLPAALALADVVVLAATRPDPSGIVAAAAQAMGKPVIVTDSGALAESVMPAATGWVVPPDDPDELARALDLALSLEEGVRQRLAARARAFVLNERGLEPMCARTLAVYRELLQPVPQPRAVPERALAEVG
jgi:glycosyltransferase involved in cell wall biosynthesis